MPELQAQDLDLHSFCIITNFRPLTVLEDLQGRSRIAALVSFGRSAANWPQCNVKMATPYCRLATLYCHLAVLSSRRIARCKRPSQETNSITFISTLSSIRYLTAVLLSLQRMLMEAQPSQIPVECNGLAKWSCLLDIPQLGDELRSEVDRSASVEWNEVDPLRIQWIHSRGEWLGSVM